MANKYSFNRDSITVNGRQFPARYEVMEEDKARGSYYTVVIFATVDSGAEVAIEVPASDRQHGAALKAAQIAAGLPGMDSGSAPDTAQIAPEGAQAATLDSRQEQAQAAADAAQIAPEGAQIEKEAQTMKSNVKRYAVYFSDYPRQAATFEAANKREAEKAARQYIRAWNLSAKIERVERLDGDSAPAQARQDSAPDAAQIAPEGAQAAALDSRQEQAQAAADAAQIAPEAPSEGAQTSDAAPAAAPAQELPGRIAARRQQARQRREAANRGETAPAADAAQAPAAIDNTSNNAVLDSAPDAAQVVQQARAQAAADAAQIAPDAAQAPEEPSPDVLEEIGGSTAAAAPAQTSGAAQAPAQVADAKAAHGPIPEKTFKNETIAGKGWSIVFDAGCNRTRVILANPIKKAARPIVEAAGFYYSRTLDSWNKKLTFRAHRAAQALADNLRAVLG